MPKSFNFSYTVTKQHPYTDPPIDHKRDAQAEAYMALVYCMAENPRRVLELRDDDVILFRAKLLQGNTFEIKLT